MTLEKQESPTLNYRFSLDALAAFKARVMLYMRNWQAAYDAATACCPNTNWWISMPLPKAATCRGKRPLRKPYWPGNARSAAETAICAGASILSDKILGLLDEATDNRRNYLNPVECLTTKTGRRRCWDTA